MEGSHKISSQAATAGELAYKYNQWSMINQQLGVSIMAKPARIIRLKKQANVSDKLDKNLLNMRKFFWLIDGKNCFASEP